jgi:group II intron reverse transcriptase/maturase
MFLVFNLIEVLVVLVPVLMTVAFITIAERKVMAAMQRRCGPNAVGIWGVLQPFADALKLLVKEIIIPRQSNSMLFVFGPCITLIFALLGWAIIPFGEGLAIFDYELGVFFALAVSSLGGYGVLISGWAANSKYGAPCDGIIRRDLVNQLQVWGWLHNILVCYRFVVHRFLQSLKLIISRNCVAENKNKNQGKLSLPMGFIRDNKYGQVNKSDYTRWLATEGLTILSRIRRLLYVESSPSAYYGRGAQNYINRYNNNLKSSRNLHLLERYSIIQPRDITAELFWKAKGMGKPSTSLEIMRARNSHSRIRRYSTRSVGDESSLNQDTKESRYKISKKEIQTSKIKKVNRGPKLIEKGRLPVTLGLWISNELNKCLGKNNKYNGLIKIISNIDYLIACYDLIKGKPGNMTMGIKKETLDGIDITWFEGLSDILIKGKYEFGPARRVMIDKKGKKGKRPLGIANPREKIVQKAIQLVFEGIWEKNFLETSHGFRPNKSVKTALYKLYLKGNKYTWVIQGDIKNCFDDIPHGIIMKRVKERICCQKTLHLLVKLLSSGYIDNRTGNPIKISKGCPQGNILSPLLCNIVLHKFDEFIFRMEGKFHKGKVRKKNPLYHRLTMRRLKSKDPVKRKEILKMLIKLPSTNAMDPYFKRLMYVRYADDFVILVTGSMKDCYIIRRQIKDMLSKSCGLELNLNKTKITNLRKGFLFLGAKIRKIEKNTLILKRGTGKNMMRRRETPRLQVGIPLNVLKDKFIKNKFLKYNRPGELVATSRTDLLNLEHNEILSFYNNVIFGLLNFFNFANNYSKLHTFLWYLRDSCALTLARKFKLKTKRKTYLKFGKSLTCRETGKTLFIPNDLKVKHNFGTQLISEEDHNRTLASSWGSKLTKSGLFKPCFICGTINQIEMHHFRSVKDVRNKIKIGNLSYKTWIGGVLRKQIPLCSYHHELYHKGELLHWDMKRIAEYKE